MEPILEINQIKSNDKNFMSYRITVTQGAEIITSNDLLLDYLKTTIPYKKGIIDVYKVSNDIWKVNTNK